MELRGGMIAGPGQHIGQPGAQIDIVQPGGDDERIHRRGRPMIRDWSMKNPTERRRLGWISAYQVLGDAGAVRRRFGISGRPCARGALIINTFGIRTIGKIMLSKRVVDNVESKTEQRTKEVCVVHLVRAHNGVGPFARFLKSYEINRGGMEHDLLIVFKGFRIATRHNGIRCIA